MRDAGYYDGEVDGVYGPATVDAVEALQEAHGLPGTGTVDKATAAALQDDLAAKGGATAQEAVASTAAVQQTLKLAGFWDGPVDGEWTPALTEALKDFQTELGVKPTGHRRRGDHRGPREGDRRGAGRAVRVPDGRLRERVGHSFGVGTSTPTDTPTDAPPGSPTEPPRARHAGTARTMTETQPMMPTLGRPAWKLSIVVLLRTTLSVSALFAAYFLIPTRSAEEGLRPAVADPGAGRVRA